MGLWNAGKNAMMTVEYNTVLSTIEYDYCYLMMHSLHCSEVQIETEQLFSDMAAFDSVGIQCRTREGLGIRVTNMMMMM